MKCKECGKRIKKEFVVVKVPTVFEEQLYGAEVERVGGYCSAECADKAAEGEGE